MKATVPNPALSFDKECAIFLWKFGAEGFVILLRRARGDFCGDCSLGLLEKQDQVSKNILAIPSENPS